MAAMRALVAFLCLAAAAGQPRPVPANESHVERTTLSSTQHETGLAGKPSWASQTAYVLGGVAAVAYAAGQHHSAVLGTSRVVVVAKSCAATAAEDVAAGGQGGFYTFPFGYAQVAPSQDRAANLLLFTACCVGGAYLVSVAVAVLSERRVQKRSVEMSDMSPNFAEYAMMAPPSLSTRLIFRMGHPTLPAAMYVWFFQQTAIGAAALVASGTATGVTVGVAAALAFLVVPPLLAVHAVKRGLPSTRYVEYNLAVHGGGRWVDWFCARGDWVPHSASAAWLHRARVVLRGSRPGWEAWVAVECAACMCLAVTQSIADCALRQGLSGAVVLSIVALRVWQRPAVTKAANLVDCVVGTLLPFASAATAIGHLSGAAGWGRAAEVMVLAAAVVALCGAVVYVITELLTSRRRSALMHDAVLEDAARRFAQRYKRLSDVEAHTATSTTAEPEPIRHIPSPPMSVLETRRTTPSDTDNAASERKARSHTSSPGENLPAPACLGKKDDKAEGKAAGPSPPHRADSAHDHDRHDESDPLMCMSLSERAPSPTRQRLHSPRGSAQALGSVRLRPVDSMRGAGSSPRGLTSPRGGRSIVGLTGGKDSGSNRRLHSPYGLSSPLGSMVLSRAVDETSPQSLNPINANNKHCALLLHHAQLNEQSDRSQSRFPDSPLLALQTIGSPIAPAWSFNIGNNNVAAKDNARDDYFESL